MALVVRVAAAVAALVFKTFSCSFPRLSGSSMFSSSLRLRPMTLLLAGALLVPVSAFAQGSPAIVPTANAVTVPVSPVPALPVNPVAAPAVAPVVDTLIFRDIDVTELLTIISTQYNVPLVISEGVSGRIPSINLSNKTPEQAMQLVVRGVSGLHLQRDADGTYIVSKNSASDTQFPAIQPSTSNSTFNPSPSVGLGGGVAPSNSGSMGALPPLGSSQAWGQTGQTELSAVTSDGSDELKLVSPDENQAKKTFQLRLRNVKPSLMAFWLDPGNHEVPAEFKPSTNSSRNRPLVTGSFGGNGTWQANNNLSSGVDSAGIGAQARNSVNPYLNQDEGTEIRSNAQFGGGGRGGNNGNNGGGRGGAGGGGGRGGNAGVFQLPTGVDRIVAVDPQNALLVFGTPEGVAQLRDTIAFLDRPLRQVEIESQFVTLTATDVAAFGIDFTTARGNFNSNTAGFQPGSPSGTTPGIQVGFVRGNFQAALTALQLASRIKVISAPRVTAINNLTASITQTTTTPIALPTTNTVVQNGAVNNNTGVNVFLLSTSISLEVTPTINNDDTVTVRLFPVVTTSTPGGANSGGTPSFTFSNVDTIANVRDGETIALGGLKSKVNTLSGSRVPLLGDIPLIGKLFRSRNLSESETELIIFVTAHIVRRAGESNFVAGT